MPILDIRFYSITIPRFMGNGNLREGEGESELRERERWKE